MPAHTTDLGPDHPGTVRDCVFCETSATTTIPGPHPSSTGVDHVDVCSVCATVMQRWRHGKRPGTYAVGPRGEWTLCAECGLPVSTRASEAERDPDGPGTFRVGHRACVGHGDRRSLR